MLDPYTLDGGERGPVTFPAFKAGDAILPGSDGGFDFHTPPPVLKKQEIACTELGSAPKAILAHIVVTSLQLSRV